MPHSESGDHIVASIKDDASNGESSSFDALSPEELAIEKKLVRRIDIRIMPWIILVYLMNYIDRNNYAAARLQGLESDLGLVRDQYQVALSLLFVGYVTMQVPSNALLNYAGRPSLYLGFFTVAWGLVSALTSQVKNFGGIVACRLILGVVEAPFFAGVLFYLSKWYTKAELAQRMAIFYMGSLISGAFGNLIAAGILSGLAGSRGMAAWQWLYIIEGAITVFIGIIVCIILPDFPETWRSLSSAEKSVASRRLTLDALSIDMDDPNMSQFTGIKLAFADPKTYLLAIAYMGITGAAGFQNFFPTLTASLGYSHTISLLLVAPPYIFMVLYSYFHGLASDKLANRFWFLAYPVPVTIVGFVLYMTTSSFGPQYFSFFLMNFVFAQNGTIYAWIASSIPRPPAKRAAALAFINSVGNSASIWTPFLYLESSKPHYRLAMGVNVGLEVLALACCLGLRVILQRQNGALAREGEEDGVQDGTDQSATRARQKGFRYML